MTYSETIELKTKPYEFYEITEKVRKAVKNSGVSNGICLIFCSGSTGAIIINEDDPMLLEDLKKTLEKIAPRSGIYHHPENAHSHLWSAMLGSGKSIPISNNDSSLGQWQDILFLECDTSPRTRKIVVTVIGD